MSAICQTDWRKKARNQAGLDEGPTMECDGCTCAIRYKEEGAAYGRQVVLWARAIKRASEAGQSAFVTAPIFPVRPVFSPTCRQPCPEVSTLLEFH